MTIESAEAIAATPPTRDELRKAILSGHILKTERVMFRGVEVEVHQPSMQDLLDSQESDATIDKLVQMILKFVYVPGTNERIFEEGDIPTIKALPWDDDITELQSVVAKLSGIDVTEVREELEANPLESAS